MKQLIKNMKCELCGKNTNMPVIESKVLPGVYLTGCEFCKKYLMTAGNKLIPIPSGSNDVDGIGKKLSKEMSEALLKNLKKDLNESNIEQPIVDLANDLLNSLVNQIKEGQKENSIVKEPITIKLRSSDVVHPTKPNTRTLELRPEDMMHSTMNTDLFDTDKEVNNEYDNVTTHVVLDSYGDVANEYSSKVASVKEMIEDMIEEVGLKAVNEGEYTLYELKPVKFKVQEVKSYDIKL